jgi:protein TonB
VPASPSTATAQPKPAPETRSRSATPRVEFIAVSGNDELLEQVGQALDGESAIRQVDTVESARELIRAAPCSVVLLEVPANAEAPALVAQLHAPSDRSVIVVFAQAEQAAAVARSITTTAAFAVLPVPIEVAKTAAVLEGARDEALSRHTLLHPAGEPASHAAATPGTAARQPADPLRRPTPDDSVRAAVARTRSDTRATAAMGDEAIAVPGANPEPPGGGRRRTWLLAGCTAAALVAGGVSWYVVRDDPTPYAVVAPETPPERLERSPPAAGSGSAGVATADIKDGAVEDLLDLARTAFRDRRYTDPKAESALVYYRSVLAQQPDNEEAREGVARIAVVLDERLQSALDDSRYDDAALAVAQLRLAGADPARVHEASSRLAAAQVAAALARDNPERAAALLRQAEASGVLGSDQLATFRAELDRQQADARTKHLVDLFAARVRDGRLLEPANDSAQFYLGQLRKLPNATGASNAAARDLEDALLGQARAAGLRRQNDELERWLAEARRLGTSNARIAAVRREARPQTAAPAVQAGAEIERLAGLVQSRLGDGRLLEPAQDSAVFYLGQLRTADVAGTRYPTSARAVSDRLLQRGREAVAERKPELAQSLASAARPIAANAADVNALEGEIARLKLPPARMAADKLKRVRYVAPEYPREAMLRGTEGSVRVRITVGADGEVADATIVESSPPRTFDRAAMNAVKRWRFEPLSPGPGEAAQIVLESTVVFRIDGGDR